MLFRSMRKQAEMGQYHGSIPTYGYCFHDGVHTKLHLDTEAASVVRGIFDQRLEGKTYADIARDLNKKEVETPTVYLQRDVYKRQTPGRYGESAPGTE